MSTSDIVSTIAVVLSFLSIVASILVYLNQRKYLRTQDILNRVLLRKEQAELATADEADVSANCVRLGMNQFRIRVFNKGKARANNIVINYPEKHNWMVVEDILPLEFLDPGQSVDLRLMLHSGAQSKVKAVISWNDRRGKQQNEVILTR